MTTTTYTLTNSTGATVASVAAQETNGPVNPASSVSTGYSSPQQIACRPEFQIQSVSGAQITINGNWTGIFSPTFKFSINGTGTLYTILTSIFGSSVTTITATATITATIGNVASLNVFLVAGNQTSRYISAFPFVVQSVPAGGANDGGYTSSAASTYDMVSGYTAIPISTPIIVQNAPATGSYQIVYALPPAATSLYLVGYNSMDWGQKILDNLIRMNENWASPNSPDSNTFLGTGTYAAAAQTGQLWYNTTGQYYEYYNGTSWVTLATGIGPGGFVPSSRTITAGTGLSGGGDLSANRTLSLSADLDNLSDVAITSPSTGQILQYNGTHWVNITGGTGSVTSIAATGGTGITVTGGPITISGTLSITLGTELQALSGLSTTGFVQRTGTHTYTAANLTGSQIVTALGFVPLTGNQTITLSGDATGSGATSITLTLANTGVAAGVYGSTATIPTIVVDGKGRLTSASVVAIPTVSSSQAGYAPASGGGTTNFLRADSTWASILGIISSQNFPINNSGSSEYLTNAGVIKFSGTPHSLTIQFGIWNGSLAGAGAENVVFPQAFTTICLGVVASSHRPTGSSVFGSGQTSNYTTTGCTIVCDQDTDSVRRCFFIAVGY